MQQHKCLSHHLRPLTNHRTHLTFMKEKYIFCVSFQKTGLEIFSIFSKY